MTMRILYGAAPEDIAGYDTKRLRDTFLVGDLFAPDAVRFTYTHVDRLMLGGAVPVREVLAFGSGAEIGTPHLLSAREMGVANLGGSGNGDRRRSAFRARESGRALHRPRGAGDHAGERRPGCAGAFLHELGAGRRGHRPPADHQGRGEAARARRGTPRQQASAGDVHPSGGGAVLPAAHGHHGPRPEAASGTPCRRTCTSAGWRPTAISIWLRRTG